MFKFYGSVGKVLSLGTHIPNMKDPFLTNKEVIANVKIFSKVDQRSR